MKRMLYLCCGFIWVVHAAYAGEKPEAEALITARVDALTAAMVKADGEALKKLTVPELSYGHSSGRVETRDQVIENIVNGNSDFLSIKLEEQTEEATKLNKHAELPRLLILYSRQAAKKIH